MYITLYYLVTCLLDSLSSVRDHFLSLCPTELTVDLGVPLFPFSPLWLVLLLSTFLALERLGLRLPLVGDSATAGARGARVVEGVAGEAMEEVEEAEEVAVEVGVVLGVGTSVAAVKVVAAVAEVVEATAAVVEVLVAVVPIEVQPRTMEALVAASASSSCAPVRPRRSSSFVSGTLGVGGIAAAALGASASAALGTGTSAAPGAGASALSGTAPTESLHTFTLDSGASRSFFRDSTTLTPLSRPIVVSLADPSGGPVLAHSSTVLPCRTAPSGLLSGLHLPSFFTNLVSAADLQDAWVDQFTPGARVLGQGHKRYFLLVFDDYSRYTTVFPLRSKGEVPEVLIDWIHGARHQLSESFGSDLPVLRLHSDRGGECSSDLLRAFCHSEGIRQTFTLPASPQQNGIAERRIGMVMDVACTSMIHAAAPHFLWPFAVQYAAHQINLQPRVTLPETTPTLQWTGKVGDASTFRVWGSRAFVRDTSTDKLSSRAVPCVFLGFPRDAPGWKFYHPTLRRVLSSQDVTFDESVSYYRLFPYRTASLPPPPPLFLAPSTPHVDPLPPQGPAPSGVSQVDPAELVEVAVDSGADRGAEPAAWGAERGRVEPEGTVSGGAEPARSESRGDLGVPSRREPLSAQQLREWYSRRCRGAAAAGAAGATRGAAAARAAGGAAGAAGGTARASGDAAGNSAAGGAAGAGGAASAGAAGGAVGAGAAGGAAGAGAARAAGGNTRAAGGAAGTGGAPCAGAAGFAGGAAGTRDSGAEGTGPSSVVYGGAARPQPYYVPLLQHVLGSPLAPGPPPPSLSPPPVLSQSPAVTHFLATAVIHPLFESITASALVTELVDFAVACRLDYATSLVADSAFASVFPWSVGGECALGTDVVEDKQEDFECFAASVPHLVSMLIAPEGDPDAPDIPTPRSYAEAIEGPSSSQWQAAMDAEMAS
ncbi:unnamed protein product [Closterium sp. NIES-65]|nr:unnamed protein product [Closterium sp. NIES-65]